MSKITRRTAVKAGGATVLAPSFIGVTTAETDSGEIELTTDSTIPAGTGIDIRVNEDRTGNGVADSTQEKSLSGGTGEITEYGSLSGSESQGNTYWLDVTLTTTDDTVTPVLDNATITLPDSGDDPSTSTESNAQGLDGIIDNYLFFVAAVVTAVAGIGITSKSLAIGAVAGYTTFALIAVETQTQLFENILIVTLVLVFIGFAFKFWRLEGMGE